eukprot:TRINITY_DN874_c0_g1_i3.p1 TRINITY_DN874_c0_g1~~TRINITY_DN874_c0_g1_i3.p1  ORF type:complete len:126 (+),score=9.36 TRINITY_DN874_c0_g1_i3:313-690(+)
MIIFTITIEMDGSRFPISFQAMSIKASKNELKKMEYTSVKLPRYSTNPPTNGVKTSTPGTPDIYQVESTVLGKRKRNDNNEDNTPQKRVNLTTDCWNNCVDDVNLESEKVLPVEHSHWQSFSAWM